MSEELPEEFSKEPPTEYKMDRDETQETEQIDDIDNEQCMLGFLLGTTFWMAIQHTVLMCAVL